MAEQPDKKTIGLTSVGDESLKVLAADHFGGSQEDAYRFAISYAVASGFSIEDAPAGGYTTKYGFFDLERGGKIQSLLRVLGVGDRDRPAATAERLAEMGITDLARRIQSGETLVDVLQGLALNEG